MTLPTTGTITAEMINIELGRAGNTPMTLNDADVRALAGVPSGTISFSDFYGKSSGPDWGGGNASQKVQSGSSVDFQRYGEQVDISGDGQWAVVGAVNLALVYIYKLSGSTWVAAGTLAAGDGGSEGDYFGDKVQISSDGSVISVAASRADYASQPPYDPGCVYMYTRSGSTWTYRQRINAYDGGSAAGSGFGKWMVMSSDGNTLAVNRGELTIYFYERSGNTWTYVNRYDVFDSSYDWQTIDVANDGTCAIGYYAFGEYNIVVIARSGNAWGYQSEFGNRGQFYGWQFGISDDGNVLAWGVPGNDGEGARDGGFRVSTRSGTTWTHHTTVYRPNPYSGLQDVGKTVAISGDGTTISCGGASSQFSNGQGVANIYTGAGASWTQQQQIFQTGGVNAHQFGFTTALTTDGSTLMAGSSNDEYTGGGTTRPGSAFFITPD